MTTFTMPFLVTVGDVEHETDITVTGTYHRGHPAYTPRGEMRPIDPPEPAAFDIESVTVQVGGRWAGATRRDIDVMPLLDEEQCALIEEQGIEEAGNDEEAGREAAAEARADARRDEN